jgi:hypothetical protein
MDSRIGAIKMNYEIRFMPDGKTVACIYEPTIGFIPFDESNSDYKQYLIDTDGGLPIPKESKK